MINYKILQDSVDFYKKQGFTRIESPWTVSAQVDDLTRPEDCTPHEFKHNNKRFVASGEQSFLYLYLKGFLPLGKFQTITPCLRDDAFSLIHTKYFMKNELIITDNVHIETAQTLVGEAMTFFSHYFGPKDLVNIRLNENQIDILYKNHELGSYGIRDAGFIKYIYGTACAEPRLSTIMKMYGISHKQNT